jgi:CrcB protein
MEKVLLIGLGGFVGTCARYLLGQLAHSVTKIADFPVGTLSVNLIGCFLIGLVAYLIDTHGMASESTRAIVIIGVLGGFTTFSAFGFETMGLIQNGQSSLALLNVAANVVLGLLFVILGHSLASAISG